MSRYQTRRAAPLPDWLDWFDPRKSQAILDEAYSKSKSRKKAKEIPGSINPDNPKQYWSGAEWLNVNDLPKPGKAGEVVLTGTGSLYNEDGSKRDLGVGFGEPSSVAGDLAVIKASKDEKLGGGSSIGETNARASLMKAATKQSPSKGSVGKNLLTLQDMRKEQNPVVTPPVEQKADATKGAQFKSNITGKTYNIPELETSPWNSKTGSPITEIPKGGLEVSPAEIFNPNSPINKDLPTFGESVKASEAMGGAGWAAGANMLGKALQMLDKPKEEWTEPIAQVNTKNKGEFKYDPFAFNLYSV